MVKAHTNCLGYIGFFVSSGGSNIATGHLNSFFIFNARGLVVLITADAASGSSRTKHMNQKYRIFP